MATYPEKDQILDAVQSILQYGFKNPSLLWEALHAPGSFSDIVSAPEGNKRIAIVGDAVLRLALVQDWYGTGAVKERSTEIVQEVATNRNLDKIGRTTGLERYIIIHGTGIPKKIPGRTMSDGVEAILGAMFLDGGLMAAKKVMKALGLVPALF